MAKMKVQLVLMSFFVLNFSSLSQENIAKENKGTTFAESKYFGAARDYKAKAMPDVELNKKPFRLQLAGNYTTYTYTFDDLLIFSYSDNTDIIVKNSSGINIWDGTLNMNEFRSLSPGEGIYGLESSNPFSLLIGDPISGSVLGYYAMDEQGNGVGSRFLTYMPERAFGQERLIVFSYYDNTQVRIRDLETNTIIWTGILDNGEYFSSESIESKFLLVDGSEPVSVLSYADQGYLLPDRSGRWTGKNFYGYAGFVGEWPNDLNIVSYENNASIIVRNLDSGESIWSGSLNRGEVHSISLTSASEQEVFFEITASKVISASISPFLYFKNDYYHLLDCVDNTGKRIGTLFYTPAINGRIDFSSFEDDNFVQITNLTKDDIEWSGTLQAGEHISRTTTNALYKIEGTGKLAGCESFGGHAGGAFVPVYYGLELPDLTLSASSISFIPEHPSYGQTVTLSADIFNNGNNEAYQVKVGFYDGDPDWGGLQIGSLQTIASIAPNGGVGVASIQWTTPEGPEHRQIYVKVDPNDAITEANESNNSAHKPLIPNEDLMPPLAVTIEAPSGLELNNDGQYVPDPIQISANIINNGNGIAYGVYAMLDLPDGLVLKSWESERHELGTLSVGSSITSTWSVEATGSPHGNLLYSVTVGADNAEAKNVKRMLYVPEPPFAADIMASWQNACVGGATIYVDRGNGFEKAGTTGSAGQPVHVTNLSVGTKLRATIKVHTQPAVKDGHNQVDDTMFEVWVDSDKMTFDGSYKSYEIKGARESYTLEMLHPIYKYNLVVSIERSGVDDDYFSRLEEGFKLASKYLYNVTDGQVMFKKIAIYQNKNHWNNADMQIHPSDHPHNNRGVNGIEDNGWLFLPSIKIHFGEKWDQWGNNAPLGDWPNESDYYTTIIHEFGHYAFGLYDEYLNGLGQSTQWADYRDAHPSECPENYGLMDWQYTYEEMSSHNDYMESYPLIYLRHTVTQQLDERKVPCWDWVKQKLESYFANVNIMIPPYGWYPDGYIYDRLGPDDETIEDSTLVMDLRSETTLLAAHTQSDPFNSQLRVIYENRPVSSAHAYMVADTRRLYLGKTTEDGYIAWPGAETNVKIVLYKIVDGRMLKKSLDVTEAKDEYVIDFDQTVQEKLKKSSQGDDPGIVLDCTVSNSASTISLELSLLTDVALFQDPQAELYYGDTYESVVFSQTGSENRYNSTVTIDPEATGFDGTGYFDISIVDVNNNTSSFTTYFTLFPLSSIELNRIFLRGFNFNVEEENFSEDQLGISLATLALPYTASQTLYPVSEMFTVKFENNNVFAEPGGMNIYYQSSEVVGLDESSLGIYKWDDSSKEWNLVQDSQVDVEDNVVSALVASTGIYTIFANEQSDDFTPPGKVNDLGATTGHGHAQVDLTWTAPGDDGNIGHATNYVVRFHDVPITHINWEESQNATNEPTPLTAGSTQKMSLTLPAANKLYYFALKTEDEAGNESELSNFTAAISAIQSYSFSLLSPSFNDTLETASAEFEWEEYSADSTIIYTLWYGEDELFAVKNEVTDISESRYLLKQGLKSGTTYYWKVFAANSAGETISCNQSYFRFMTQLSTPPTGNELSNENIYFYPNPFNPDREIGIMRFSLSKPGNITIKIYDTANTLVKTLIDSKPMSAQVELAEEWNGKNDNWDTVANGVYFYVIESSEGERAVGKIAVLR